MARSPTNDERAVIDELLSHSFEGVEALREQWANALVESSCTCGCGSIGFVFAPDHEPPPSDARNPLPVEGEVVNENGDAIGGLSLAIAAGADVKVLQRMLGHTSTAMTLDRYGHLMPSAAEAVADRLDALAATVRPRPAASVVNLPRAGRAHDAS